MNFVMHKLWIVLQVVIFLYELLICRIEKLLCPLWCKKPWITQMHDDDDDGGGTISMRMQCYWRTLEV